MAGIDNNPTVSIIIPTYNRSRLIARAVKSVLNQTYQNFELIIVDDGSTDDTREIVAGFNDKRIRYVRHEENKGEAAARNTGIKVARGGYIAYQDSDDEWFPEKLARQMELLENASPQVGVIYTGFWKMENLRKTYIPFSWVNQKNGDIHRELLKGNFIGSPVVLIKKDCFNRVGLFDERLRNLVDWEMWIRISKLYHFRCVDEPLVIAHYGSDNVSDNSDSLIDALELILEKNRDEFKEEKRLLAGHWINIGKLLVAKGRVEKGRQYIVDALRLYPFSIRLLSVALLVFFGLHGKIVSTLHAITTRDLKV
ncbi:MAG: glycosyltransferase [Sedimentisphaerales bacterium]